MKMNRLLKILGELHPESNITHDSALIDDKILTSLDLVTLVTDLNDAYGIEVGAEDITPDNFNSIDAIASLVRQKGGEICN